MSASAALFPVIPSARRKLDMESPATRGDIAEVRESVENGQRETRSALAALSTRVDALNSRSEDRMREHEKSDNERFTGLLSTQAQLKLIGAIFLVIFTAFAGVAATWMLNHWKP